MTIGNRLDEAMRRAGIRSQTALARSSGVPQATISRTLKGGGKSGPETETIRKLAAACNVSFEWLSEGIGEAARGAEEDFPTPDEATFEIIPQLDVEASCGHGKFQDYATIKGGLSFKRETLRQWGITPSNGRIIYTSGQSMEPTIQHGRVVLINTSETEPIDNKVFLMCDSDGGIMLKRLVREYDSAAGDMTWKMRSDNPNKREFPDKPMPAGEHVTIIGRAVWNDSVL